MLCRRELIAVLVGITLGWSTLPTQAETTVSTVTLDRVIHFSAPDGNDVLAEVGTYLVQPAGETHLHLLSQTDQPAIEIQADPTPHEETISTPTALLIAEEDQDDEVHLVLLLPDGQSLDATGTFSGTRSRGKRKALSASRLHTSLMKSTTLLSGVASPPSVLYSIASTGALKWYRHNGAQTGAGLNTPGAWTGPTDVGSGWQSFIQVVPGGGNVLYGISPDGTLKWYSHDDAKNGTFAWQGAKNIGTGWQSFKQVFSGSEGILYAIAPDGTLKWYHHTGYRDGAATWEGPKTVGTGWQNFKEVFGMGDGVIYAIAGDGKLKWYKHTGFRDGTFAWEGPKDVGTGWQNFKEVFAAGNGVIYAIASDGILKWYKHTGYQDGSFRWEGPKDIGTGWQGFSRVVSLLPLSTGQGLPSATGKWITWNYLFMNHPEIVAQALADVQTNKQPRTSVAGLASEAELNDMFKTNWTAEVSRLTALRKAGMTQAGVTSRGLPGGLSLKDLATIPSAKTPLPPIAKVIPHDPIPIPLPPQDLGGAWSGNSGATWVTITAPFDGYIQALLPLDATKLRFRIPQAWSYTGELVNGRPVIDKQTQNRGDYDDILEISTSDDRLVSMAGIVRLDVKRGQQVIIEIVFEPTSGYGPPVGNYETTLEVKGFGQTGQRWLRTVQLRARSLGINFNILAYAAVRGHVDTLTNQVVEMPIVVVNAAAREWAGTLDAIQLPPGVAMDPVPISFLGQGKQWLVVRFRVSDAAKEGPAQPIVLEVKNKYGGSQGEPRSLPLVNLSMTIYHPWVLWCFGSLCGEKIPGIPDNRCCHNKGGTGVDEIQLWIKDDGQWSWKIDTYNSEWIDLGGSDFVVKVSFNANNRVWDRIHVHIGPGTISQYYEQTHTHPWVQSDFLRAAKTGVTFSLQDD